MIEVETRVTVLGKNFLLIGSIRKRSYKESNFTANSSGIKFLYNSQGLDVISLLVKYNVPLAHINKVIKILKFKSAINLLCL